MDKFIIDLNDNETNKYEVDGKNLVKVETKVVDNEVNRVSMYMSKEAMISFGIALIKQAHLDYSGTNEHVEPISEFMCSDGLGIYLTHDSERLLILSDNFKTVKDELKIVKNSNTKSNNE